MIRSTTYSFRFFYLAAIFYGFMITSTSKRLLDSISHVYDTDTIFLVANTSWSTHKMPEPAPLLPKASAGYVTFQRNPGYLHSQLFNLAAALMTATQMNRTLLVPPEEYPHAWTGMFKPELQWWDLESLMDKYDLELVVDLHDDRLTVTDAACKVEYRRIYENFEETKKKYDPCPIIDIGGGDGLFQCQEHQFCGPDQRLAFDIFRHLHPGPVIRKLVDRLPPYRVAVHSRFTTTPSPATDGNDSTTLCTRSQRMIAASNLDQEVLYSIHGQCQLNQTLLDKLPNEPFLLARDDRLDFATHYADRTVTVSDSLKQSGVMDEDYGTLESLVELFGMVKADYFYGMINTLATLSTCLLRGDDKKYDSNVCWALMHAESQYAEPPTSGYQRIACMIPVGANFSCSLYETMHATWGKRCDILRFFPDPSFTVHKGFMDSQDVVPLPMIRRYGEDKCGGQPCRHLWEKVWRMWVWTADNLIDKADWFLKLDPDTFFFPETLRKYVEGRSPEDDLYAGHQLYHESPNFIAGAAVLFSRSTVRKLAGLYRKMPSIEEKSNPYLCVDRSGAAEDLSTGVCAKTIGILPTALREDSGEERVLLFDPGLHFRFLRGPNKNFWYWKGKPDFLGDGKNCCSDRPFAIHNYKNEEDLFDVEEKVYSNKKLNLPALNSKKRQTSSQVEAVYFDRVRSEVDRTKRIIVGDSKLINVQVFFALCYYMPFDDLVCDPAKSQERQYNGSFALENAPQLHESMKEAERWAYHRQPWIVSPTNVTGDLNETFPPVRPYRVVSVVEGDEVNLLRQRFGTDMMVMQKDDFADREKCPGSLRSVLYFWDVPYSHDAVLRACRETQAGQMTTTMMSYLDEGRYKE